MDNSERLRVLADTEALAESAADETTRLVRAAIADRGVCTLVLSGGSTPRRLYERLSAEPYRSQIDWSRLQIFWGDERSVPPTDPASNYALAREALLCKVPIPDGQVHRIAGELEPSRAAATYEEELLTVTEREMPRLDVVLLGMGADGHTASLFPGTPALGEEERLVVATVAPVSPRDRVTLTLPVLNAARAVLFVVQGEDKARALAEVMAGGDRGPRSRLPAARVRPERGELQWLVDRASAGGGGGVHFDDGREDHRARKPGRTSGSNDP